MFVAVYPPLILLCKEIHHPETCPYEVYTEQYIISIRFCNHDGGTNDCGVPGAKVKVRRCLDIPASSSLAPLAVMKGSDGRRCMGANLHIRLAKDRPMMIALSPMSGNAKHGTNPSR